MLRLILFLLCSFLPGMFGFFGYRSCRFIGILVELYSVWCWVSFCIFLVIWISFGVRILVVCSQVLLDCSPLSFISLLIQLIPFVMLLALSLSNPSIPSSSKTRKSDGRLDLDCESHTNRIPLSELQGQITCNWPCIYIGDCEALVSVDAYYRLPTQLVQKKCIMLLKGKANWSTYNSILLLQDNALYTGHQRPKKGLNMHCTSSGKAPGASERLATLSLSEEDVMFDGDIDLFERPLKPFSRYKISNGFVVLQRE